MISIGKEGIIGNQMNGRRRPVYLTGSEDCPAYGAMEIYGYTYTGGLMVRKPTADDLPPHLVCFATDVEIRSGSYGVASQNWPVIAKYDNSLAVSNREAVGTRAGQWKLSKGYEGFLAVGPLVDTGYISVMPEVVCRTGSRGGYYYNENPCGTRCCCWRCGANRDTNPYDVSGFTGPTTIRATVTTPCIGTPDTDSVDMAISFCGCNTLPSPCTDPPGDFYDQMSWTGQTVDTVSGGCTRCFSTPIGITWADQPRLTAHLVCTYINASGSGTRMFQFYWYHWGDTGAVQGGIILGTSGAGSRFMCNPFRAGPFQSFAFTCPTLGGVNTTICTSCEGGKSTILLEQV